MLWLCQIVYEKEILYLFTVTFWEKVGFHITNWNRTLINCSKCTVELRVLTRDSTVHLEQ